MHAVTASGHPHVGVALAERSHRSTVYGLAALLFECEPTREFVDLLRERSVRDLLREAGMDDVIEETMRGSEDDVVAVLAADYATLFVSPPQRVPLNESVHDPRDTQLMGEATAEVRGVIESLGLHVAEQWRGLPDHVSVELEVLRRLIEHEALAERAHDDATVARCRTLRHEFLDHHVLRWVPGVCDDIAARAGTSFYRELALLTREMLANEST
jgi:TorA maturation chaperone TorD